MPRARSLNLHTPHTHHTYIHTQHATPHTQTQGFRAPLLAALGLWPRPCWGTAGRRPSTPSPAPARVPSSFLHSTDLCFPSCLIYRSRVPLQGLEVLAALQDEDMARGPDDTWRWATLVMLAALGTAVTATTNPGVVARITQKGLDYGNWMPSFSPLQPLRSTD